MTESITFSHSSPHRPSGWGRGRQSLWVFSSDLHRVGLCKACPGASATSGPVQSGVCHK